MIPFSSANILLPKDNFEKWSVIACDQFTSDNKYWENCKAEVSTFPSTLNITLPEIYLEDNVDERIVNIHKSMKEYLDNGVFVEYKDAMIYVERTLPNGAIRKGIVGQIDLEQYSYTKGEKSLIRPTEQTVVERIPPRVKIRNNAPLELPHIMLLIDNQKKNIIEPLSNFDLEPLYDFDLMMGGGHIKGYLVPQDIQKQLLSQMENELDPAFPFAVGDGNHSLATAKAYYESQKQNNPNTTSRYALCEIVNIHDDALEFEPIYRTIFNVDCKDILDYLSSNLSSGSKEINVSYKNGSSKLYAEYFAIEELQILLDKYLKEHPECKIDYIHGLESAISLSQKENVITFTFDGIQKSELFPIVSKSGVLPRKTFSMGEAQSKRYYVEAKLI